MGFTPLEGLVMATRSGSVDPGLLLWLLERDGRAARASSPTALEHRSGLLGLPGAPTCARCSRARDAGDARASLALDVYLHRLRAGIAAMAAALGGLDVLVFTGGVGEHAPAVRERAGDGLALPRRRDRLRAQRDGAGRGAGRADLARRRAGRDARRRRARGPRDRAPGQGDAVSSGRAPASVFGDCAASSEATPSVQTPRLTSEEATIAVATCDERTCSESPSEATAAGTPSCAVAVSPALDGRRPSRPRGGGSAR